MPKTFSDLLACFSECARAVPDKAAIILSTESGETARMSYQELLARSSELGRRLAPAHGQRALIMLPSGPEYAVAFLGCLFGRVLAVPLYAPPNGMHVERLSKIAKDCEATYVLTTRKLADGFAKRFGRALDGGSMEFVYVDEVGGSGLAKLPEPQDDEVAYLQYTSGSTGSPRGVMVTHGNIRHYQDTWQQRFAHQRHDVFVSWLPLFHDMGLLFGVIQPLMLGASSVLMPPATFLQQPVRWLRAVSDYRGSVCAAPNFAFELCRHKLTDADLQGLDLSSWQIAVNGAEPIRAETIRGFAERFGPFGFAAETMIPGYGLAETTLGVSTARPKIGMRIHRADAAALLENRYLAASNAPALDLVSSGPTLPGLDVRLVDPQTRREVAEGHVGEVWVSGKSVTLGYWNRPEETEAVFGARLSNGHGPYLRTGDLAVIVAGELSITGRLKDVLIVRGQNHYPQDLEATAVAAHPALKGCRAAAFMVQHARGEKIVVLAEVVRTERKRLDGEQIARDVRASITLNHGINIQALCLIDPGSIRITSSGKIQRGACRDEYLQGKLKLLWSWQESERSDGAADVTPPLLDPSGPSVELVGAQITSIVAKLRSCKEHEVGKSATFAELGMDSYHVVELATELSDWLKRPVETDAIFNHPTIEQLAAFLVSSKASRAASEVARPPSGASEVAIVGMSCRFPGAPDLARYWELLHTGATAVGTVPTGRWDGQPTPTNAMHPASKFGGFLDSVDTFDAAFFGVAPREAQSMDPQQRLLLEGVWHALEDAGIPPESLAGTQTGVFVGISSSDYSRVQWASGQGTDAYAGTGSALSIAANRISYVLDLRGPSMAVDTACSSALVALHQACRSLLAGECETAIVAGVNLLLSPDLSQVFSEAKMLSSTGACRTFDASADGYVRSEGCGVVVLTRAADTRERSLSPRAIVLGTAINQDGKSNGLTAPNGPSQQAVMHRALAVAGIDAGVVSYVEAHGTGTPLGDPIEAHSIRTVYGAASPVAPSLWLGSAKANVGHLEAAAGIAGVIKVVLALQNRRIPGQTQLRELNPRIQLTGSRCEINTSTLDWNVERRVAAVSAFGFGGANAHAILSAVSEPVEAQSVSLVERPTPAADVLVVSAASRKALRDLESAYAQQLPQLDAGAWQRLCRNSQHGRQVLRERAALVARSASEAASLVRTLEGQSLLPLRAEQTEPTVSKLGFLFTGQGAQYVGAARELFGCNRVFREHFQRCSARVSDCGGPSLLAILQASEQAARIDDTSVTQPLLFAIEYALALLLRECGVLPSVMLGHSLGEYVAACLAGVFDLDTALALVTERGRLMQHATRPGVMTSLSGTEAQIAQILADPALTDHAALLEHELLDRLIEANDYRRVSLAAINSPRDIVVSGEADAVERFAEAWSARGVHARPLHVTRAFHSGLMLSMLPEFRRVARSLRYSPPELDVVSNIHGKVVGAELTDPDYWARQILAPVRFGAGVQTLKQRGVDALLEVGPHPVLSALARASAPELLTIETLRRGQSDEAQLGTALARAFVLGLDVDWEAYERSRFEAPRPHAKVALPSYPFERIRHWVEASSRRDRASVGPAKAELQRVSLPDATKEHFRLALNTSNAATLYQHRVSGVAVLPGASFLLLFQEAAALALGQRCVLQDIEFVRPCVLPGDDDLELVIACERREGRAQLSCHCKSEAAAGGWLELARAVASPLRDEALQSELRPPAQLTGLTRVERDWYADFDARGLHYGACFRALRALWSEAEEAVGELEFTPAEGEPRWITQSAQLDAVLHTLIAFSGETPGLRVPASVARFALVAPSSASSAPGSGGWTQVSARRRAEDTADLELFTGEGQLCGQIEGLRLQPTTHRSLFGERAAVAATPKTNPASNADTVVLSEWRWSPAPRAERVPQLGQRWLLLVWDAEIATRICSQWGDEGLVVETLVVPNALPKESPEEWLRARLRSRQFEGVLVVPPGGPALKGRDVGSVGDAKDSLAACLFAVQSALSATSARKLFCCTEGAFGRGETPSLSHSLISGLVRAGAVETPHVAFVQVDVEATATANWSAVLAQANELGGSGHLRCRDNLWHQAELGYIEGCPSSSEGLRFSPEGSYLITGGAGGIGRELACWLAGRGAKRLLMLSRHATLDHELNARLATHGAASVPVRADVADPHALRAAVGDALQGQTLRGIFHAAGVRRDMSLLRMTWQDVDAVLEAKHSGTWNLHQLTLEHPVEHFVLFSSVASSMGSAGQANYAAANAFLDALAHVRRANGQVALSVNWGPWAEVGMAAQEGLRERLAGLGFPALATRDAFDALGRLLAWRETPAQVGIAGLRLAALRAARSGPVVDRLLGALLSEAETPAPNGEFVSRERLSTTPPPELERVVTDDLFARLCRILRTHKEHEVDLRRGFEMRVLGELGLDSLMAVELRNRLLSDLGVDVPMHVMLGGGRVTDIVDLVCVQVKLHALVASNDASDEGADEETYVI